MDFADINILLLKLKLKLKLKALTKTIPVIIGILHIQY